MIDWLTILIALAIIVALVIVFGFMAWKINMPEPLLSTSVTGKKDDTNQLFDSNEKKKRDKSGNDQSRRKKDQKKSKRSNKVEDQPHNTVHFKEPSIQTSEETDNEREESEQESSPPAPQVVETSSKAHKRNRNKARPTTPPPSTTRSATQIESILINKDEKSPVTTRAQPISHPKLATVTPKDEVEPARQHQQQAKLSQASNKQTLPAPAKKTILPSTNVNQEVQQQQEQPFTTVGGNRHKSGTPPLQQQPNKSVNTTPSTATLPSASVSASTQQPTPVQVQHEQLAQRQPPRQQKETPTQLNGFNANPLPVKQQVTTANTTPVAVAATAQPKKLADLVKALPTSQIVVTELMSALDAFPLSTDELDIIMHKIANKQAVIKQDWTKLQHGQKVDPQAHIGQVMDESAKAYEEDMKNNAIRRIKELTDELNNEKRRTHDLLKEKDVNIQTLHAQLNAVQHQQKSTQLHPQQQNQLQTLQLQLQRLTEDNIQLNHQLAQQQFSPLSLITSNNNNNNDPTNIQVRVLSEQIKKLSVDNANFEKKLNANESVVKETQKEKDDLIRSNQQLTQKAQDIQKQFQYNEEKLVKDLNESRTLHINQLNEYKRHVEQLTLDNERLQREEIVHVEPTTAPPTATLNNEEREKLEQEINQLKQTIDTNQQRFDQQEKESNQFKQTVDTNQQRFEQQEKELNQFKQTVDTNQQRFDQQEKESNQLKQTIDTNQQRFEQQEKELNQLKQTIDANQQRLEQQEKEFNQRQQQSTEENEQYKKKLDEIENQHQSQENELRNEIERLKQDRNAEQNQHVVTESIDFVAQIDALRAELDEVKEKNDSTISQLNERLRQEQDKQKTFLAELLEQDVRKQLPNDQQDFDQWLSSYRQLFESTVESNKRAAQDESAEFKRENDLVHKNMSEVENQLRQIENIAQSREEILLADLKSKDATLEIIREENDQLNGELQRLRAEVDRLQLAHESAINETRELKFQLDERFPVTVDSPSNVGDDSFEFVKQPLSPPPTEIDPRAEQWNELIRSSKEALENQDSIAQQLDKRLNDIHPGGTGETSTSNVDESTVFSSSDQQQTES